MIRLIYFSFSGLYGFFVFFDSFCHCGFPLTLFKMIIFGYTVSWRSELECLIHSVWYILLWSWLLCHHCPLRLTWLKALSLQMWSIGHQRTVSTTHDPVLLLLVNPMWHRLPSSLARLLFSRCSLVCLYSFVLEVSTGELFLRRCLLDCPLCLVVILLYVQ